MDPLGSQVVNNSVGGSCTACYEHGHSYEDQLNPYEP